MYYYIVILLINLSKKHYHKILEKSKIKKKNVLFNICGSIIDNKGDGIYTLLIEKDYANFHLNKNDICLVHYLLIKK